MKTIRTILSAAAVLLCCASCSDHIDVVFDTPFVSIKDESGASMSQTIGKDMNNYLTTLDVRICVSDNWFKEPITIEYETIVGNGLTEGVDFKIQPNTKSPLTFEKGVYSKPVRIIWMKNEALDPTKDCTLTIKLKESSLKGMVIGYPGPDAKFSRYTFIKQ